MGGGRYEGIMPGAQTLAGVWWFEPELAGRREGDRRGGERRRPPDAFPPLENWEMANRSSYRGRKFFPHGP